MPQQIFVIHGGDAYNSYEEYLKALKAKEFKLEKSQAKGWKANLQERLGDNFDVYTPRMPNGQNAKYAEWKIWFEKMIPFMEPNVILIGHSLGGIFLAKYLSENTFPVSVRSTLLAAAPFNTANHHPLADFVLLSDLSAFQKQGGEIILFHSKDDLVVPFSNAEQFQAVLSKAQLVTFTNRGHFNDETFEELVDTVKQSR